MSTWLTWINPRAQQGGIMIFKLTHLLLQRVGSEARRKPRFFLIWLNARGRGTGTMAA